MQVVWQLAIALGCGGVWAQDSAGEARVLVLDDGGVLTGAVAREADDYVVTRSGGQIRISASRVQLECGSLQEAYSHRRRQMTRPTAESHLALADWCLRYGLIEEARRELSDAQALDGSHPRLALLTRRLANAKRGPRKVAASSLRDEPAGSLEVEPLADVPAAVLERFTRKVQPVLVNNCTTSGCHAAGGTQTFQLDRALLHGLANRRSTMNNLAATLALVDREQPQQSALLTVPREAHGGLDDPIFGPRQAPAFKHLVEWVALVTDRGADAPPAAADSDIPTDVAAAEAAADSEGDVIQTGYDDGVTAPPSANRQLRVGATLERWQPRDEFDPEIFNRRHRAKPPTAGADEPSSLPGED